MPNLFRSLFKPASRHSDSQHEHDRDPSNVVQNLTPSEIDLLASPDHEDSPQHARRPEREVINILAQRLLRRIEGSEDQAETMRSLLEVLRHSNLDGDRRVATTDYSVKTTDNEDDGSATITPYMVDGRGEPQRSTVESRGNSHSSYAGSGNAVTDSRSSKSLRNRLRFSRSRRERDRLGDSERTMSTTAGSTDPFDKAAVPAKAIREDDAGRFGVLQDQWARVEGEKVIEGCSAAQAAAQDLKQSSPVSGDTKIGFLVDRCIKLVEAQRQELEDILVYLDKGQYPALRTLGQIYDKITSGMRDAKDMQISEATRTLSTLVAVLEEGPDYLIDTLILELITHHAEAIDQNLGYQIRQVLNRAIAAESDLTTFRRAAESVVTLAVEVPEQVLDDELARASYRIIGLLVKQLRLRVDGGEVSTGSTASVQRDVPAPSMSRQESSLQPTLLETGTYSPALSTLPASLDETINASPLPESTSNRSATPMPEYTPYNATDLTKDFGTGPIPTPSRSLPSSVNASNIATPQEPIPPPTSKPNVTQAPTPASPASATKSDSDSDSGSDISIFEYDGHFLTHSALDLVLAQEVQLMADSSGQYRGEVSWDDVRNAWIPKWAVKLKPGDLAEGEVPTTNPADFKIKEEDAWGNKISWREDGRMFYVEDPVFPT